MSDDFVLVALEILKKQRVVARRRVFGVLARGRDNYGADRLQLREESVDFAAGWRPEGKMMKGTRSSSVNRLILEGASWRRDGEGQPWMAVLDNMKVVRIDDGARLAPEAETEEGKQLVVKGDGDSHVLDRYLNVIDDRIHLFFRCLGESFDYALP
jgi:hypothetical protein